MAQERMAETIAGGGGEGGTPPPGVPKVAYEISQARWGGKNPLENVRGQLEGELNPEGKDPVTVVTILQKIDNMDAGSRERNREVFQQACDILAEYAHKEKLLGLDAEVIKSERNLDKSDQDEINLRPPEQRPVLAGLLDNLDATEEELTRVDNTLKDDNYKGLFSENGWEQLKATRDRLATDKARFEQQITGITSQAFLDSRNTAKAATKQASQDLEIAAREERDRQMKQQLAEPEDWESELEKMLLEDRKVILNLDDEHAANYEEHRYFVSLPFARLLEYVNDPNNQNAANLEQAKTVLEWYFKEARRLGVFEDLDERLKHKYREWANSLLLHREMNQLDMLTESPGRLTQKTFAEVEDEIIEYFNTLLDSSKPQYVEQSARWDFLQRRGLTPPARVALQGIRAEFVRRAQTQIEDSLSDFAREVRGQQVLPIPIDRISGEWNVHRIERGIRERRERQSLETGSEPLYREESYYRIRLLGNTRQEIEMGADQAAENIIQSATTFNLELIQQRMEMLRKAVREKSIDLQRSEKISESEAVAIIEQMEDTVTNKIDFFILDWAGRNLQMPFFSSYLEQRMQIRGVEKLRQMPSMNDGLVGLALYLLMAPRFRLYFRPQGFKGQLFDDDTTHKYLRKLLEKQAVGLLMQYELKGKVDDKGKDDIERVRAREKLTKVSSIDEFLSCFDRRESPRDRVERARQSYQGIAARVKSLKDQNQATSQALEELRMARMELAREQRRSQKAESKAKSAFETASQVMNIFGESADLGAPSIVMDNGDYIGVEDATLFYKYAILQAAKGYGEKYGAEDNPALIRWRSRMWIQRWKAAGLDRGKTDRNFSIRLKDGREIKFTLKAGFEETGLTEREWKAFEEAVGEIRKNGFNAQINGVKFEDIIKMEELKAVRNNFLADYKSSESQINNEVVLEQVAKGKLPVIRNILRRLGLQGRQGIEGNTTQQRIDNLTQMIEDSRALHAELERLAYFEATHGLPQSGQDPRMLSFSADRIDYGFQNESWGVKRLHHLKAFWYANLRRTVPRAVDLIHAMPFSLGSLAQEMTFDNILDLALNVNTTANGLESVDNPALTLFAQRHKGAVYIRSKAEGDVVESGGGLFKDWGFLEKPLVDANNLWKSISSKVQIKLSEYTKKLVDSQSYINTEYNEFRENIVSALWTEGKGHLGRFAPIVIGTEKQLGLDRQATSSGAGFDENEKFALRFLEWLMSEKRASEEQGAREEAGMEAYKEVRDIVKLITTPNSYRSGSSLWDEVWRKLTPSHNIRLPNQAPPPTYIA